MKTKNYQFTAIEIFTIRDALVEYWQLIKSTNPVSPLAIQQKNAARALADPLKIDAAII